MKYVCQSNEYTMKREHKKKFLMNDYDLCTMQEWDEVVIMNELMPNISMHAQPPAS